MEATGFPTSADIYLELDGRKIAVVQGYTARASKSSPYPQLAGEVRAAVSDLAALKFEVLQKVGDAVGNIQTYQL